MKKWIAALLCAVMLTGLCACGETRIEPLEAETEKTTETASQTVLLSVKTENQSAR